MEMTEKEKDGFLQGNNCRKGHILWITESLFNHFSMLVIKKEKLNRVEKKTTVIFTK